MNIIHVNFKLSTHFNTVKSNNKLHLRDKVTYFIGCTVKFTVNKRTFAFHDLQKTADKIFTSSPNNLFAVEIHGTCVPVSAAAISAPFDRRVAAPNR